MPARTAEREEFLGDIVIGVFEDFGYAGWRQVLTYHSGGQNMLPNGYILDIEEAPEHRRTWNTDDKDVHQVTIAVIAKGIGKILEDGFGINSKLKAAIKEANTENDAGMIDAELADIIVQAGLFGEIVYG